MYPYITSLQFGRSHLNLMCQKKFGKSPNTYFFGPSRRANLYHMPCVQYFQMRLKFISQIMRYALFFKKYISLILDHSCPRYDYFSKNTYFKIFVWIVRNPNFHRKYLRTCNDSGSKFFIVDILTSFIHFFRLYLWNLGETMLLKKFQDSSFWKHPSCDTEC